MRIEVIYEQGDWLEQLVNNPMRKGSMIVIPF